MGTIHLICEADTDANIVRAILKAKGFRVRVERIPMRSKQDGLSWLVKDVDLLIQTAIKKRQPGDCIAVLHDVDEHTEPDRRRYEEIETICKKYQNNVVRVVARDEIEAWLFADEGICKWLGIKPDGPDTLPRPSERLNTLVKRKTGHDHTGVMRAKVLDHLNGTGDKHSPSLKDALEHLENAPCVREASDLKFSG